LKEFDAMEFKDISRAVSLLTTVIETRVRVVVVMVMVHHIIIVLPMHLCQGIVVPSCVMGQPVMVMVPNIIVLPMHPCHGIVVPSCVMGQPAMLKVHRVLSSCSRILTERSEREYVGGISWPMNIKTFCSESTTTIRPSGFRIPLCSS